MATLKDMAEEWLKARAALIEQLASLEADSIFPSVPLSESQVEAIASHIQGAIDEYDALLGEYALIRKA